MVRATGEGGRPIKSVLTFKTAHTFLVPNLQGLASAVNIERSGRK